MKPTKVMTATTDDGDDEIVVVLGAAPVRAAAAVAVAPIRAAARAVRVVYERGLAVLPEGMDCLCGTEDGPCQFHLRQTPGKKDNGRTL